MDFIPSISKVKISRTICNPVQCTPNIKVSKTLTEYEKWYLKTFGRLPKNEI